MAEKEYIEREAALEIVKRTSGDYAAAFSEIGRLPTADVVEVVRCKDCKFLERTDCFGECSLFNDRGDPRGEMSPNDFCSYGIPKERKI